MAPTLVTLFAAVLAGAIAVRAESHSIRFDNQCGEGTPQLIIGGQVVSTGQDYNSNGPAQSGIAYLQTGPCQFNGEQCTLVEFNMANPQSGCEGCGSFADLSLIAPHALNVPAQISFTNACDGTTKTCTTPDCAEAYHQPNDNQAVMGCATADAGLLITFCPGGSGAGSAPPPASSGSASPPPASSSDPSPTATSSSAAATTPSPAGPPPAPSAPIASGSGVVGAAASSSDTTPAPSPAPASNSSSSSSKTCNKRRSARALKAHLRHRAQPGSF